MSVDPAREQLKNMLRRPSSVQAEQDTGFDPGEHTVADVQTYITDHPDEVDAIYEAEQSGKARSTLLDWLAAQGEP